jgi:hypothetical protein
MLLAEEPKIENRNSKLETGSARSLPVSARRLATLLPVHVIVGACAFTGFEFRISVFRFPVSAFQFRFSNFEFLISNFAFRSSGFYFLVSIFYFRFSNFQFPLRRLGRRPAARARRAAASTKSGAGTSSSTKPSVRAWLAGTRSALNKSCVAAVLPIKRVSRCVPPHPVISPREAPGYPKDAS